MPFVIKGRLLVLSESYAAQPGAYASEAGRIDRLAALDDAAWQSLYDEYFLKLRNFAYARSGDLSEAEDIASEVFGAALRGIEGYQDRGAPIGAWLFRIARNLTTDHLRRRGRRPEAALGDHDRAAPFSGLGGIEDRDELMRGMRNLTEEQQTLIGLRFFSDCSLEEAAKAMNKSVGAVKGLQQRALASMRRAMTAVEKNR